MTLLVGVVVEGKDDFDVIEAAVVAEFTSLGLAAPAFRRLQPEEDATGAIPSGGWSKVIGWLKTYSGTGVETFFTPLFSNTPGCDLIVVHIDADIYKDCLKHLQLPLPAEPPSVVDLTNALRHALDFALSVSAERRKSFAYAVPVFKTENWIMASVTSCPQAKWSSVDAKDALKSLFDATKFNSIKHMRGQFVAALEKDSSILMSRAKSYQIFANELIAIVNT